MKIKTVLLFLIVFGITGYFRERFFEHLNIVMAGAYRGTNEYEIIGKPIPAFMVPFSKLSYATLYYSKYAFTLFFVLVFYFISLITIKRTLNIKLLTRSLNIGYILLLLIAGISMAFGYLMNGTLKNDEYTLSRWLLGIAQSPIICLILLAAGNLYNKSFQSKS